MGALETVKLLYIKGHHNSGKEADYKMGKTSYQLHIWYRANI